MNSCLANPSRVMLAPGLRMVSAHACFWSTSVGRREISAVERHDGRKQMADRRSGSMGVRHPGTKESHRLRA
jgi:hypothetical protein